MSDAKKKGTKTARRMFLKGAGGAVLALPFLESLVPRRAAGQTMTPPKRFIALKTFSTQLVKEWYPRFTGNGYQLKDSKYSGSSKADGTTLLTQKVVSGKNYTWAPLHRFPDADRDLRHPRPGAESVPLEADADPRPRFPPRREPQLRRPARQLLVVHGGHAVRRRQHRRRPDHRSGDGVFAQGLSDHARPPLPAHLAGRRQLDVVFGPRDEGRRRSSSSRRAPTRWTRSTTCSRASPAAAARRRRQRDKLLVDRVYGEYTRLKQNSRLSGTDKQLVDRYVTLVSELQAKLSPTGTPMMSCTKPVMPASMANNTGLNTTDITTKWNIFLDVVAAAVMCDRTRVITIGVHKALGPGPDSASSTLVGHYHSEDASGGTWHGLAHDWSNANSRRMLKGINAWVAERGVREAARQARRPRDGRHHLPRQLAGLLGQRARLQPHRVQRPLPAGGQRGRLHQARALHRLHRLGRQARTSHKRTATSSEGSRTTSSW